MRLRMPEPGSPFARAKRLPAFLRGGEGKSDDFCVGGRPPLWTKGAFPPHPPSPQKRYCLHAKRRGTQAGARPHRSQNLQKNRPDNRVPAFFCHAAGGRTDARRLAASRRPFSYPIKFFGKEGFGEEETFFHKRFYTPQKKTRKQQENDKKATLPRTFPAQSYHGVVVLLASCRCGGAGGSRYRG